MTDSANEINSTRDRIDTIDNTILELLKELHSEDHFTIVLVTHDPYVSTFGDRILRMEDGHLVGDEEI